MKVSQRMLGTTTNRMMKITFCNGCESAVLKLEGRLAGPWVNELEKAWRSITPAASASRLVLDLCAVTFVDAEGRHLLEVMHESGVELIGNGIMTQFMIDGIKHRRNGNKTAEMHDKGNRDSATKVTTTQR